MSAGRYLFHVHRTAPAWRLVLAEGCSPEEFQAADWTFTRLREAEDVNGDVRAACDRDGYCLFKIGASFAELRADLAR